VIQSMPAIMNELMETLKNTSVYMSSKRRRSTCHMSSLRFTTLQTEGRSPSTTSLSTEIPRKRVATTPIRRETLVGWATGRGWQPCCMSVRRILILCNKVSESSHNRTPRLDFGLAIFLWRNYLLDSSSKMYSLSNLN